MRMEAVGCVFFAVAVIVVLTAAAVFLLGCEPPDQAQPKPVIVKQANAESKSFVSWKTGSCEFGPWIGTFQVDGCKYILSFYGSGGVHVLHAANCSNHGNVKAEAEKQ